jgi:soluble lytic murein transglycosylase-like protein
MDHAKDHRIVGEPDEPRMDREMGQPYRPFAPRAASESVPSAADRRHADRRHAERRSFLTMGGRRNHEDRRRRDRRIRLAGAGLLAAVAFGVGGHEIAARMDLPGASIFAPSEPATSVDVATDFHLPAWDREALEPFIQEAATTHGMSPSLIRAVIQTESRFNPLAVSRVGAQGLMQLMPGTARHVGIENPFDPRENILGGTKYLSTLLDRFKGNTAKALAAYNAGPTVVARHRGLPPYRETQGYVRKIQKLVQNTDAEFSLPVTKVVRKASLRSRATRKAAISRNAARGSKSSVHKASKRTVKKASVRAAKKPVRRASRRG